VLAAKGAQVTVLERAAAAGGKLREMQVAGRAVDSGPTVLTMRPVFEAVFDACGERFDDHVPLERAEVIARHFWHGGACLDLYSDIDRSADAVGRFAGAAEARGYRAFCDYAKTIHDAVEGPFMRAQRPTLGSVLRDQGVRGLASLTRIDALRTVWKSLGDFFRDARLRQLFARYATYCGSSPWLAPATLNVIAHVEREGVWYVRGGMYRLVEALAALCVRHGAVLRTNAHVSEVIVERGVARAVRIGDEVIEADAVVLNADTAALSDKRFGAEAARAWRREPGEGRSLSAVTYSMATRVTGAALVRHNVFFSRDYAREFQDIFERDMLPTEPTVYVCAHDRGDSARAPDDGIDRALLIVNAPARGGRSPFSAEEIDACTRRTRALLESQGLTFDWSTDCYKITTPDLFEQMFPSTGGALYGPPSHGWKSPLYRAGARSNVPGIFLAGGSVHPGAGVPMVARSGLLAAESVWTSLASISQ
jgi:1-hydroxycarotenoid 3,4-desaturase